MIRQHVSIILRSGCYFFAVLCVNFGKEFVDVGAAKLHDYLWSDWTVLAVPTMGNCLITMTAFFDKSFSEHMANGGAPKAALSAADFKVLMEDWKKQTEPPKPNENQTTPTTP